MCDKDESHQGYSNRETWAVALHINNDQGWQESVHEALREARDSSVAAHNDGGDSDPTYNPIGRYRAGEIIRENVEAMLEPWGEDSHGKPYLKAEQWGAIRDIGSLWRVNWQELGASFLADLSAEGDGDE